MSKSFRQCIWVSQAVVSFQSYLWRLIRIRNKSMNVGNALQRGLRRKSSFALEFQPVVRCWCWGCMCRVSSVTRREICCQCSARGLPSALCVAKWNPKQTCEIQWTVLSHLTPLLLHMRYPHSSQLKIMLSTNLLFRYQLIGGNAYWKALLVSYEQILFMLSL